MNWDVLKPILASAVRHALTTLGGAMVTDGVMQSSQVNDFVGAGMVIAGVAWSWWQKVGQAQVQALLKRATQKSTLEGAKVAALAQPEVVK